MFTYWLKNKFSGNEKGQFAPIFLVNLAILVMMTMVTVNLNKVALTKTDSSNAVDAGGLAAGSSMANTFNSLAASNAAMIAAYHEFYANISTVFMNALRSLQTTETQATKALDKAKEAQDKANTARGAAQIAKSILPLDVFTAIAATKDAISNIENAIKLIKLEEKKETPQEKGAQGKKGAQEQPVVVADDSALGATAQAIKSVQECILAVKSLIIGVNAFHTRQFYSYLSMRKSANKGRRNAVETGHKIAFANSNVGGKLKSGEAPADRKSVV
jgi:hypothetical protein